MIDIETQVQADCILKFNIIGLTQGKIMKHTLNFYWNYFFGYQFFNAELSRNMFEQIFWVLR